MGDVGVTAGRQIVDDRDLVALADQLVRKMTADESGPAGNENFHII